MRSVLSHPAAIGFAAFVLAMFVIGMNMGPTRCNSGWKSSSIGRQGACSHHGGVNRTPETLRLLASMAFGIGAGLAAQKLQAPSSPAPTGSEPRNHRVIPSTHARRSSLSRRVSGSACSKCGSEARALVTDGRFVMKCQSPECGLESRFR